MIEPERQLWRAVLLQAVMDATASTTRDESNGCSITDYERARARRWLVNESRGFRDVCGYAGVDPRIVRQKAMALAENDWIRTWVPSQRQRHERFSLKVA